MIDATIETILNNLSLEKAKLKARIFMEVFTKPEVSRKTIIDEYQLRSSSVSQGVADLVLLGLIRLGERKAQSKPGRPEFLLDPCPNRYLVFSSYVEGRTIIASLVNLNEESIFQARTIIPKDSDNRLFNRKMVDLMNEVLGQVPSGSELLGAGISMLGALDSRSKVWFSSNRWPGIRNIDFKSIEEKTGIVITLRRSLDSELHYILTKTPQYRKRNVLLFNWGFGLGATYSQNGIIMTSRFGRFADIGKVSVNPDGSYQVSRGNSRPLESIVTIESIVSQLKLNLGDLHDDEKIYHELSQYPNLENDPFIKELIRYVATALSHLVMILYPDDILFLGPLTENPGIFQSLLQNLAKLVGSELDSRIRKTSISNSFQGACRGNTYSIFHDKLFSDFDT